MPYPGITAEDWYIDIMTANLVNEARRSQFQVFVLPNLYGDIITDEAAQIQGGVGTAGSANVGFFITRLMLLFGQFNYGRRGILALSHKRLFTIASLARLMRYAGYRVVRKRIMAAPYPRALGNNLLSRGLMAVNRLLAKVLPGLFAYQVLLEVRHTPSTESVLRRAQR